ncbi:GroES-like protein [Lophiostoma macrostomum CBS 122681]|uniref:GroES-like protein n=1 Tax=Lophiostoma macrostomum CBS 122681 TaxID=1314788 RepID=A0A6A6SJ64_9PLEO|nr:GroES-like protein [Lophiostoma macrostomum CBS 122681]
MQLTNFASWIPSEKAQLQVAHAPFPKSGDDELVIQNHAIAINPVDWKIQSSGGFSLSYPAILGEDVAGEILEVGSNVRDQFRVGQRVIAHSLGLGKGSAYGGFQLFSVLKAATTSLIPDDVSFREGAVLPLSISTAAAGLYMKATLGLDYPETKSKMTRSSAKGKKTSTLLLWGGSTSVGSSVIQLASASGYAVTTTASPSNYDYSKTLGANFVLDYHNPDIVPILIALLKDANVVGAYDAVGSESTVRQCAAVLDALGGGKIASVGSAPNDLPKRVKIARIGSTGILNQEPEVAQKIWGEYVPAALDAGKLVPAPKALVAGKHLEDVQEGLDVQKKGVSARKVVITLR